MPVFQINSQASNTDGDVINLTVSGINGFKQITLPAEGLPGELISYSISNNQGAMLIFNGSGWKAVSVG